MSTYQPLPGVYPGRPPCANCNAAYRLHHAEVAGPALLPYAIDSLEVDAPMRATGRMLCPVAYRPDTLEAAERELAEAEALGDQARIFVARGNLQRLSGQRSAVPVLEPVRHCGCGHQQAEHVDARFSADVWRPGPCTVCRCRRYAEA